MDVLRRRIQSHSTSAPRRVVAGAQRALRARVIRVPLEAVRVDVVRIAIFPRYRRTLAVPAHKRSPGHAALR